MILEEYFGMLGHWKVSLCGDSLSDEMARRQGGRSSTKVVLFMVISMSSLL